jgi:tripartite-type tricarboxylate transporter receptor subunit TctC
MADDGKNLKGAVMDISRRSATALLAAAATGIGRGAAAASAYPSSTIKLVVPFAAGGVGDVVARLIGDKLGKELGQTIVVDNRSGANSELGTEYAARAKPDGYTMIQMTPSNTVVTALQPAPFDVQKDFTTVIGVAEGPEAFVVPAAINVKTMGELVAYARAQPNGINYATGGLGSMGHLGIASLMHDLKIKATPIHYRGSAPAAQSILSNTTQLWLATVVDVFELAKGDRARVIGVAADARMPNLPNVPTLAEQGLKINNPMVWYAYNVPTGTPKEAIDKLAAAFTKVMALPELKARLLDLGVTVKMTPGPEMAKYMHEDFLRWKKVIEDNGIKGE